MRAVARCYLYWPGIDEGISNLVRSCTECARVEKNLHQNKFGILHVPEKPWQRMHIDYAGPVGDWHYLILVNAHTKWAEVVST